MAKIMSRMMKRDERGMALMLALFALLLLSGIGLCMVLSSNTETRIDANYGGSLRSYYAAHSGLEEMRDRISYPSTAAAAGGLADLLPKDIAGNAGGVLYVVNPVGGETVDPSDPTSAYFDVQLCHDYNSGVTIRDSRCTAVPATAKWMLPLQNAAPLTSPDAVAPGYKWVRINMKTNRIAAPYFVDQVGDTATLDTRVCWDGKTEQLSPGGATPACDANGMQPVYMLTSLALAQGTRNLLRSEVVGASIRPPGAITMDVGSSASTVPITAIFNVSSSPNATLIPLTSIDGRVHNADGSLSTASSCSQVAALASNSPQGTTSLQTGLNALRQSIVQAATNSCNADGSSISASNPCTAPLAWVRGTGALPRFTTTPVSASPTPTPVPLPTPAPSPTPFSSSNSGSDNSGHGHDDHNPTPTPTPTPVATPTPTPTPLPTTDCSTATQSCYTNLDLSDSHLTPAPLFAGNPGNSGDPAAYQSPTANIVVNENQAVLDYIAARKASGTNYYELASTSLNPAQAYGTPDQPAVLVITDSSLKLNANLTGFGILQVPNDFEISSRLQWTGIVMVRSSSTSPTGQFFINAGANGSINGALMLQALTQFFLTTSSTGAANFTISYSCEAIDAAMGNRPLKVVSQTETSY
jgi:hypothetical protein